MIKAKGTIKYLDHSSRQNEANLRPMVEKLEDIKTIILDGLQSRPTINVEARAPHVEVNVPSPKIEVYAQPAVPQIEVTPVVEIVIKEYSWPKLLVIVGVPTIAFLFDMMVRVLISKG